MHTLPELGYAPHALEPYIDAQTMILHHDKHHATYVEKLNAAISGHPEAEMPLEELLRNINDVDSSRRDMVRNHGGGHYNHTLFWRSLSPSGGGKAQGDLLEALESRFGDFDTFKQKFTDLALSLFGSGWTWLIHDPAGLRILNLPNQDSPLMWGMTPLLGIDVWEHAYYLRYQNRRPEYLEAIWNVIDWEEIGRRYGQLR